MDRAPGLSVRLKLTLSYAGFLMVAGGLVLAAVWVVVLRYIPDGALSHMHPSWWFLVDRSDPLHGFGSVAAIVLTFLLIFGLLGGWLLAGRMLAPLARITDATRTAATGSLSHRIRLPGRRDEFRELADAFDAMLGRIEAHVAEQQRFAANASHELRTPLAITQTLLDVARNDQNRGNDELVDRLHAVNTRAIDLTEALLLLSRADQRSFSREPADLSLLAEEATETLLPLAEKRGLTLLDLRRDHPHPRLSRSPAADDDEPRTKRHCPQSARTGHRLGHHRRSPQKRGAEGREHWRAAQPSAGRGAGRTVSAGLQAYPHRSRRCRPRPDHRQAHRRSTRRNVDPHPPGRGRTLRHGSTTRRATAPGADECLTQGMAARPREEQSRRLDALPGDQLLGWAPDSCLLQGAGGYIRASWRGPASR